MPEEKPIQDLDLAAILAAEKGESPVKPPSINDVEMEALVLPRPEWLIHKVIPKGGLVGISGRPGSQKTFFSLWLGLRVAEGLPLFESMETDFFCEQQTMITPTMIIEEENTLILTKDRRRGLKTPCTPRFHYRVSQGFKLQDKTWREALLADVEEHQIGLIIMDPFSSVMGLDNENDNAEVAVAMDLLRKDFIDKGITIIFIHHPAKGDGEGKGLRGAGDIFGKCDVVLNLEKDAVDKQTITVSYEKMRLISELEVQNFKMRLTGDSYIGQAEYRYLGEAASKTDTERNKLKEDIKGFMQAGLAYNRSEVAAGIGSRSSNDRFDAVWKKMVNEGEIYQGIGSKKFVRKPQLGEALS